MSKLKIQEGNWVRTSGLNQAQWNNVVEAFVKAGAKDTFNKHKGKTDEVALSFTGGDLIGYYNCPDGHHNLLNHKELTLEQVLSTLDEQPEYPTPPFKLSCGDKPEVRQWLKDQGYAWSNNDDLTTSLLEYNLLFIESDMGVTNCDDDIIFYIGQKDYTEVFPEITTSITWTTKELPKDAELKLDPEVERKLEYIQSNIEAMQEELEFIKSKYQVNY